MSKRYVLPAIISATMLFLVAGNSYGQSVEDWRATEDGEAQTQQTQVEGYNGVTPGSGNTLPKIEALKGKEGSWVTWPGFLMRGDGGSRFFIQNTGNVEYKITVKKKKIVIQIKNTKVFLRNNKNPLVTTHFNTPVKRAYLKKSGKNVEIILELKTDVTPKISQSADKDGYNYMFIDFAPGQYPLPSDKPATIGESEAL